ncbi:hypothetical protein EMIT0P265_10771 [Pseudomonas zeae]
MNHAADSHRCPHRDQRGAKGRAGAKRAAGDDQADNDKHRADNRLKSASLLAASDDRRDPNLSIPPESKLRLSDICFTSKYGELDSARFRIGKESFKTGDLHTESLDGFSGRPHRKAEGAAELAKLPIKQDRCHGLIIDCQCGHAFLHAIKNPPKRVLK